VVGEAGDELVVEEDAVGHVGAGDERVLQLGADVDGLVVDLDVGVLLVERGDGVVEDLEEVAFAVPDGDLAAGARLGGRLQLVGCGGVAAAGDAGSAGGEREGDGSDASEGDDATWHVVAGLMAKRHGHSFVMWRSDV
jgi:hypothetical protein